MNRKTLPDLSPCKAHEPNIADVCEEGAEGIQQNVAEEFDASSRSSMNVSEEFLNYPSTSTGGANFWHEAEKVHAETVSNDVSDYSACSANAAQSSTPKDSHNDKALNCAICGKNFEHRSSLKAHLAAHTNERPFICTICGATYKHSQNLKHHNNKLHADKKAIAEYNKSVFARRQCSTCGQSFLSSKQLELHQEGPCDLSSKSHPLKEFRAYRCIMCGESFHDSNQLKLHVEREHQGGSDQEIVQRSDVIGSQSIKQCDTDSMLETGIRADNLRVETQVHIDEEYDEKNPCKICGRTFPTKFLLIRHSLAHDKPNVKKCKICGQLFVGSDTLQEHTLKHTH